MICILYTHITGMAVTSRVLPSLHTSQDSRMPIGYRYEFAFGINAHSQRSHRPLLNE
jgi:hypothetical protein